MAKATSDQLMAEFVGTFLLVFTVGCNTLSNSTAFGAVSIACVLMVAIYALGGISGANFNPAVSFTLAVVNSMKGPGGMDWGKCATYCGVQLLAGILGALSYSVLFWNAFYLGPKKGNALLPVAICEILFTFMLCFVVLNVAVARKYQADEPGGKGNEWYGLAIGFVIIAGGPGASAVGGGCFNPAVAIGIDMSSVRFSSGWFFIYTIFELIGAALAAVCFKLVRPSDFNPNALAGKSPKLVSEFLGTFILVFTVGLTVLGKASTGAFSIAAALMCMIYALGDISGAHFNPAVTLAIFLAKLQPEHERQTGGAVAEYMLVQIAGGIVAAFTYALVHQGKTFPLGPTPDHTWNQVLLGELIFTMTLCFVVLCTAVSSKTQSKTMFGLAIGSCVTVGGFAIGSTGGGCLNPAVAVGIASSQIMNGGLFFKAVYYTLFEFLGAGLAAAIIGVTHSGKDKTPALTQQDPRSLAASQRAHHYDHLCDEEEALRREVERDLRAAGAR